MTRRVALILCLGLCGCRAAELAIEMTMTVGGQDPALIGYRMYQPSATCKPDFNDDGTIKEYEKVTCISTTEATSKKFANTDSECSGTETSSSTINLPMSDGGVDFACKSVSTDGYVTMNKYSDNACSTLKEVEFRSTGVCAVFTQAVEMASVSYRSSMVLQDGSTTHYPGDDCTGEPFVKSNSATCTWDSGDQVYEMFSATPSGTTVSRPQSAPQDKLFKTNLVSSGYTMHEPAGICTPQFISGTKTVQQYSRKTCVESTYNVGGQATTKNVLVTEYFGSADADCVTVTSSIPKVVPSSDGGGNYDCVDIGSSTGYIQHRTYTINTNACGDELCKFSVVSTGVCNSYTQADSNGYNSYMNTESAMEFYTSSDCSGTPAVSSPRSDVTTCPAGQVTDACWAGEPGKELSEFVTRTTTTAEPTQEPTTTAEPMAANNANNATANNATNATNDTTPTATATTAAPAAAQNGGVASSASCVSPAGLIVGCLVVALASRLQ